jgi:hypothetical protein
MIGRHTLLTAVGLLAVPCGQELGGPVVEITHGRLRRVRADGVVNFRGLHCGEARRALDDLPCFEYSRPASFVHA